MRRTVLFFAWPQYDTPELEFWMDLRTALAIHGLDLVLVASTPPPDGLTIEHVPFVPTVDSLWTGQEAVLSVAALGLDPDALLTREEEWSGPAAVAAVRELRRGALDAIATHVVWILSAIRPVSAVIWNGQHVPEVILDAALRQGRTPVLYVERAPVPLALFADECGLSAASGLVREVCWPVPAPEWLRRADEMSARMARGALTWWDQPPTRGADALRRELHVSDGQRVLLFAAQVDEDTQRFLFSPVFPDNLAAWQWFLDGLARRDDAFVLGKHHPKAKMPPEAYARVLADSGVPGVWRTDIAIDDALAVAERVAAVNSTVLYEALARGTPALAMGEWLLSGRGAAYEVHDPIGGLQSMNDWMEASDTEVRNARWREALGFLLSRSIYAYEREAVYAGRLGARELAARIAGGCEGGDPWQPMPIVRDFLARNRSAGSWRNLGEPAPADMPGADDAELVGRWHEAHTLRYCVHQARGAVRQGRRVVIVGTGQPGRMVRKLVTESGAPAGAFVSSQAEAETIEGLPVIGPDRVRAAPPRDFVLIASPEISHIWTTLSARGFEYSRDVLIIDCETLLRLADARLTVESMKEAAPPTAAAKESLSAD